MNEQIQTVNVSVPERTAETVALEIRTLQRQAQGIILSYAIEIGQRLVEAKSMLPHGEWGAWLKRELDYSQSTAQNFMRVYKEYGADQQSLFGGVAKSQAFGDLTYSKALKLLAIPDEEEREKFVAENDVASMSTRELAEAIRARDDAEAEKSKLEKELQSANDKLSEAQSLSQSFEDRAAALSAELEELKTRPVEVAVQDASEEQLALARAVAKAEAEAALQKKLDKAKFDVKKAKDAQAQAEEAKAKAEADLKAASESLATQKAEQEAAVSEAVNQAKAEADERAKALEKKLAFADPDTAAFKVHFETWMEEYNRMSGYLSKITQLDAEKGEKLSRAIAAALENMRSNSSEGGRT